MIPEDPFIYLDRNGTPDSRLYFIGENTARVTFAKNGQFGEAPFVRDLLLAHRQNADMHRIQMIDTPSGAKEIYHERLSLRYRENEGRLAFFGDGKDVFLRVHRPSMSKNGSMDLRFETQPGEGYYGFGEWFNGYRRTRGSLTLDHRESPAFTQHKQTYSAYPCFLSDRGYMVMVLNAHRGTVRFHEPEGFLHLGFEGGYADFIVFFGPSWKRVLRDYTRLTGRPPMVPIWAFGLWNTSYPVENQSQTLARVQAHRERRIPLDVVILDYHWQAGFHNFRWRNRLFPDPDAMIARLRALGVKLGLIYTPYINTRGIPLFKLLARLYVKNHPAGVSVFGRDDAPDMYEEGMRRGYLVGSKVKWWLGVGRAVDFTNPAAVAWWFEKQQPLLDQGVSFFKNDGGEYLPRDTAAENGLEPGEFHNIYAFYYTRGLFESQRRYQGNRRTLVFSRATWAGCQRYPGIFLGDQTPEFQHIGATMKCGLNMSLLGFAYWGADVFGLYRKPSPEIHRRYAQWALLNPIARYFSSPGVSQRNPWRDPPECEESFRCHADLRMQLLPYFYRLARDAYTRGVPILRPLMLEFQEDPETRGIWQQVMIGDTLMMAPVLSAGVYEQRVYFPDGYWFDWWDRTAFQGPGWQEVAVRPDRLPLFVRGGRPLVLGPPISYIANDHRFDDLTIYLWPPFDGHTRIYEDDGGSLDYQSDGFAEQWLQVSFDSEDRRIRVAAAASEGDFAGRPKFRDYRFFVYDVGIPRNVRIDDRTVKQDAPAPPAWRHDPAADMLQVHCRMPVDKPFAVEIFLGKDQSLSAVLDAD